jgi:ATP/ADP translocase
MRASAGTAPRLIIKKHGAIYRAMINPIVAQMATAFFVPVLYFDGAF